MEKVRRTRARQRNLLRRSGKTACGKQRQNDGYAPHRPDQRHYCGNCWDGFAWLPARIGLGGGLGGGKPAAARTRIARSQPSQ